MSLNEKRALVKEGETGVTSQLKYMRSGRPVDQKHAVSTITHTREAGVLLDGSRTR